MRRNFGPNVTSQSLYLSVGVVLALAGCAKDPPREAAPAAHVAVTSPSAAATAPQHVHLGDAISGNAVALGDVASHAADYAGKTFTTTGTVTAVCQEMGCWMEIKDDSGSGQAHVRMHGHSFYVPRTASGRHARVQGTIVPTATKTAEAAECDEEATKQMGHAVAKIELDATGIDLD